MATLYISEFKSFASIGAQPTQVLPQPSVTDQTVAIGASSTQSSAFNAEPNVVLLSTDAICSVAFGANPTAAATNMRLPANTSVTFAVIPGQRVAVITNT